MSIIHDALKKTQNNLNNNQDKNASNKMNTENPDSSNAPPANPMSVIYDKLHKKPDVKQNPPHPKSPTKRNNPNNETQSNPVMTFFTIIFCLFIITGAGWFIYQYYAQNMEKNGVDLKKALTIKPQKLYTIGTPKKPRPKPAVKVAQEEKNIPSNTIILSGITMMGEKRVALINNEIYQVGESVQGKKIISISIEKVELEDNTGNITTLKVKGF